MIRNNGFHGAPMSRVAQNADVATGTIYHYFESKEQLICQLYAYNRLRVVEVVEAALESCEEYREKFFTVWKNVFDFYIANPNLLVFFEQFVNSPFNTYKVNGGYEDRPLYKFIMDGIKSGILKNNKPEILLTFIVSSGIAIARLHQFGDASLNEKDLDQAVEMVWEGIAKR